MSANQSHAQARMTWAKQLCRGQLPAARGGHSAVKAENQLVVFGGHFFKSDSDFEYLNDVHVLDMETLSWQKVSCSGEEPKPRYGHSAVLVGSRMFIFGGKGSEGKLFRDLYFLDLLQWTWVPVHATTAGPTPRLDHASILVGRKIVLHGGWDGISRCMEDMWVFDSETFTWIQPRVCGFAPSARFGHSLNLLNDGRIVSFGGARITDEGLPEYLDDFRQLDPETMKWSHVRHAGMKPSARSGHTATVVEEKLLVFGGWGYGGCQCPEEGNRRPGASTAFAFDTARDEWMEVDNGGKPPQHLYGHVCVPIAESTVLLQAGWNGHQAVADLVVLEI